MLRTGVISSSYARLLLQAVDAHGQDSAKIAAEEGICLEDLDSGSELTAAEFGRLCQRAMAILKDESVGMVSGGPVVSGTFRMMCLCVIHCPDLGSIVKRAAEFFDVCFSVAIKPKIAQSGNDAGIGFALAGTEWQRSLDDILRQEGPLKIRTSLYMWHNLLNWFAGRPVPLLRVEFGFAEPHHSPEWAQFFRCPVRFDCAESMIVFSLDVLALPNVQTEQSLYLFLKSAPYRLIVPSYHEHRFSDRVLALFGDDYSQKLPGSAEVSQRLGVSVSTLRRQLLEEGNSFQQLKDDCRRAAAMQYLASPDLSFSEVAGLLGFDEVSAFFRAFRRWTNMTPSEYRQSL